MSKLWIPVLAATALAAACDKGTTFGAATPLTAAVTNRANSGDAQTAATESYAYKLVVGSGAAVLPQAKADALPSIYLNNATSGLAGKDLAAWQVKIYLQGQTPGSAEAVQKSPLDLSGVSGMVTAEADFVEASGGRTGSAVQSFFVDGEAPRVSLLRLSNAAAGDQSQVFWSATDNYRVNVANSELIGCTSVLSTFNPTVFASLATLPPGCALVYGGADLFKQPAQLTLGALTIDGTSVQAANVHYALYAEDMVGLSAFTWITEPGQDQGQLVLTTLPAAVQYTNKNQATINLQLQSVQGSATMEVSDTVNSADWPSYAVNVAMAGANGAASTQAFAPQMTVPLVGPDGLFTYAVQATDTANNVVSNTKNVLFILDTTPPVVSGIQVAVPGNALTSQAEVNLTWSATDLNGISSQLIEIMQTGDTGYTPVATIAGGQTSYTFPWGTRSSKGFVIRISATDPAGNIGKGVSTAWTPQVFNAAILTSSVNCFFCHVKVVGDIGGINFSQAPRSDTGIGMSVTGSIYGTNTVPQLLGVTAAVAAVSNYANTPLTIFPKNNQFPVLTAASLTARMDGTLQLGTQFISRTYQGNLILDGSQVGQPIIVNGEVYINGDLVIKGKYKGVGTIYANNIYVVNDLTATKSAYPFSDDPTQALLDAKAAIANGDDALYLGALNQVVVGSVEAGLTNDTQTANLIKTTPYSWLPRAKYVAMGVQSVWPKDINGNQVKQSPCCIPDPTVTTDQRTNVEVGRVDAYIYAQNVFVWKRSTTSSSTAASWRRSVAL